MLAQSVLRVERSFEHVLENTEKYWFCRLVCPDLEFGILVDYI